MAEREGFEPARVARRINELPIFPERISPEISWLWHSIWHWSKAPSALIVPNRAGILSETPILKGYRPARGEAVTRGAKSYGMAGARTGGPNMVPWRSHANTRRRGRCKLR